MPHSPWWGSVLDLVSMNVFIGFVFSYAVVRWKKLGVRSFLTCFIALNSILLTIKLIHGHGSTAFGVMALVSWAIEVRVRRVGGHSADGRLLAAAAGSFVASFAIWLGSHNDGVLCVPGSWLQGHAIWHLGCAAATGFIYLYMRSEQSLASRPFYGR